MNRNVLLSTLLTLTALSSACLTVDETPSPQRIRPTIAQMKLINWMVSYYKSPDPDRFPEYLKRLSAEGLLEDERRQFPFLGFAATVFARNPGKVPQWMNTVDSLPERERKTVLIALWLSDTKSSRRALSESSRMSSLRGPNHFDLRTDREPPSLDDIDRFGGYLDIQWGRFFASGTERPIRNILSVLQYAKYAGARRRYPAPRSAGEAEAVRRDILLGVAMWSLKSNCEMHSRVLDICESVYREGQLGRLESLALRAVLAELKPDKYDIEPKSTGSSSPTSS